MSAFGEIHIWRFSSKKYQKTVRKFKICAIFVTQNKILFRPSTDLADHSSDKSSAASSTYFLSNS